MKNRISLWALSLLFTALFLAPQAHAWAVSCSNADFSGNYVANYTGVGGGAGVETLTSDGNGHITTFSTSVYGFNIPFTLWPSQTVGAKDASSTLPPQIPQQAVANELGQGTYVVNPDCSMTLILNPSHFNCFAPPVSQAPGYCYFPIHWDVELVDGGKGFIFITTDTGVGAWGAGVHL